MTTYILIDFEEPINSSDIQYYYPKLPVGLNWNMNENQKIIGIYFKKKDRKKLYDEIHNVLWFFGSFE